MDLNSAKPNGQQLDPKLREAYNRIMGVGSDTGTNLNTNPVTSTPTPTLNTPPPVTPTPLTNPFATNQIASVDKPLNPPTNPLVPPSTPNLTSPATNPLTNSVNPVSFTLPTNNQPLPNTPISEPEVKAPNTNSKPAELKEDKKNPEIHGFVAKRSGQKISPVIIVIAVTIFLIAYTLFWLKLFNVNIPL